MPKNNGKLVKQHQRELNKRLNLLKEFNPKTETQQYYYEDIKEHTLSFGIGASGSGKSFVAIRAALEELVEGSISRIYITRPIVTVDEEIGILPGDLDEKLMPYFQAITSAIGKITSHPERLHNQIQISPLALMRGITFDNCFVIGDEFQNVTPSQMKMFLTRIGSGCRMVVNGDPSQKDIRGPSGLDVAIEYLDDMPDVSITEFTESDIVRSNIVSSILERWKD